MKYKAPVESISNKQNTKKHNKFMHYSKENFMNYVHHFSKFKYVHNLANPFLTYKKFNFNTSNPIKKTTTQVNP